MLWFQISTLGTVTPVESSAGLQLRLEPRGPLSHALQCGVSPQCCQLQPPMLSSGLQGSGPRTDWGAASAPRGLAVCDQTKTILGGVFDPLSLSLSLFCSSDLTTLLKEEVASLVWLLSPLPQRPLRRAVMSWGWGMSAGTGKRRSDWFRQLLCSDPSPRLDTFLDFYEFTPS